MGVPKFYRWLSERFPLINQLISSTAILPEFDNFYLDMNGIIHACTHPNDNLAANSLSLREMMLSIFRYVDRIVTEIVKPKKLLFLAIDGVAPRAKLNQQRARRFRAAQDRTESIQKAKQRGDMIDEDNLFDSNCITPGTEFMETVSRHLKYFIRKKVKEDPLWQNLTIIFSGHDVPGEGEHKIMQYIRDMRALPGYEPNLRHCMYGQDADLIMLGLASHEPHFALLREVIHFNTFKGKRTSSREVVIRQTKDAQFQLLHLSVLREYLIIDFAHGIHHPIDQERVIDDFIFLTFLVGNDFLPHLPTLDISENAFDVLIGAYRQLFQESPGYIVGKGEIEDYSRLENLFKIIGSKEQDILANRELSQREFTKKKIKRQEITEEEEMEMEQTEEALQAAFEEALMEAMHGEGKKPQVQKAVEVEEEEEGEENEEEEQDGDEEDDGAGGTTNNASSGKDYRGRYYYEKFKIIAQSSKGEKDLENLMINYLRGLMWCLAYYMKGCISWTWYYPFHYGPMLQDMKNLFNLSTQVSFTLGQPFTPYQQLLGCLPPASSILLPKCYQWLMTNKESPIIEFYPLDFGIDQDGKKNPWEAVILLDFIDEKRLISAESQFCTLNKLTKSEILRNKFGKMLSYAFDPSVVDTYLSCNPEIGLPDLHQCHSKITELNYDLNPGHYFKPELVEGTVYPIPGFPSLTILTLSGIEIEPVKLNIFGSESRYKTVVLSIHTPPSPDSFVLKSLEPFLGSIVYVNYPQIHEGKVVGIGTETEEIILNDTPNTGCRHILRDDVDQKKWKTEVEAEEARYLSGRGLPGTGGLRIGEIKIKFKVQLLQGLSRDPVTGATKKVFSSQTIAEIPVQMVLTSLPTPDPRFEEVSELPIEKLMPVGAPVIAVTGQLIGCSGTIIGPHKPYKPTAAGSSKKRQSVQPAASEDTTNTRQYSTTAGPKRKVVDVEFRIPQPEAPFGYNIAKSITEDYYSSREVCNILKISPSTLGKIVGTIRVEPNRIDIGLNLKRKGMYQLLGYVRRVEPNNNNNNGNNRNNNNSNNVSHANRSIWSGVDTVKLISMENDPNASKQDEGESIYWEYATAAILLLAEYKYRFPQVFDTLEKAPSKPSFLARDFYANPTDDQFTAIMDWLKSQPFYNLPRTPFTTSSLPHEAMIAIERAADVQTTMNQSKGYTTLVVKGIPIEKLYCNIHRTSQDVPLAFNQLEPRLGDRVVNLCSNGVPLGLRGTVITIHQNTKFVEVIFDEEFIAGKSLSGSCSQFRGKLCPWTDLLLISGGQQPNNLTRKSNKVYTAEELGAKSVNETTEKINLASKSKDILDVAIHHKQEENIVMENQIISQSEVPSRVNSTVNSTAVSTKTSKKVNNSVIPPPNTFEDDEDIASIDVLLQKDNDNLLQTIPPVKSEGKGWSNLIEQAGVNPNNLEEALNALNLATMPRPPMPPLIPNNLPPPPPLIAPTHVNNNKNGPKVVLNKQAATRLLKHELGKQQQPSAAPVVPAPAASTENGTKPITAILKNAKKLPAGSSNPPATNAPAAASEAAPLPPAPPAAASQEKTAALTALLGKSTNKKQDQQQQPPQQKKQQQQEKPKYSQILKKDDAAAPLPPVDTKAAPAVAAASEPAAAPSPSKKKDITNILSKAKAQMKKKINEETTAPVVVPPPAPAVEGEKAAPPAVAESHLPPPPPPANWVDDEKDEKVVTTNGTGLEGQTSIKKVTHLFKQTLGTPAAAPAAAEETESK